MRKFLLLIFSIHLLIFSRLVFADELVKQIINIDSTAWTQEQKNMTQAMAVKILYENGVIYQSLEVQLPQIVLTTPLGNWSILTKEKIEQEYQIWKTQNDLANQQALVVEQEKLTEYENSQLKTIGLAQIDTYIDNLTTMTDVKAFLKKLTRYIKARE